jgi:signal transduction histidine kinase
MSDRARVRILRSVAACGAVTAAGSFVVAVVAGSVGFWWQSFAGVLAVIALVFATFVWITAARQPRNGTVWAMSTSALLGIHALAFALVPLRVDGTPFVVLEPDWVPSDTAAIGWVLVVGQAASVPGLFVPLTIGVMVFPDGRLPSPRWRPLALLALAAIAVMTFTHGWWYRPGNTSHDEGPLLFLSLLACVLLVVVSVAGLIARFRHSSGTTRLQYKWIVWGTGIAALVFGGFAFVPDTAVRSTFAVLVATLGAVCWVVSYGVAVGRYRLYDIDVVISRTLLFLGLAALITGLYAIVVVVIADLVGGSSVWFSVAATALIAVAFEPVRARLQIWANRLVYGRRETPYAILGALTQRLSAVETSEALLTRLAEQLLAGIGARRVVVWRDDAGALKPIADAVADGAPVPQEPDRVALDLPIEHDNEVIGRLTIEEQPGAALRPQDIRLARDLAGSAGLVVRKLRLDHDLAAMADQIAASRRRLVGAQDDELRRLERELNSGIEQEVVALKVQLRLAELVAAEEGSERAGEILHHLADDMQDAVEQIRALAQGIYPPLLDADGLAGAIPVLAARAPFEVSVDVDADRYCAAVEGAVYFCITEALTNAVKHGTGPISVCIAEQDGVLTFAVRDTGPGFDTTRATVGAGLHNMQDRLEAFGGELQITSSPGAATTITGRLPLRAALVATAEQAAS